MSLTAGHRSRDLERIAGVAIAALILLVPPAARADTLTLSPTQDSWIAEGSPNANHENDNVLHVRTGATAVKQRALVQFDLGAIPSCGVLSSAVLKLTITNPPPTSRTHGVHTVSKAWTEAGVSWNSTNGSTLWTTPGGDFNAAATSTAMTGITDMAVIQWTVTSDVLAFIATPSSNHGWLVKDVDENNGATTTAYASSENATVSQRPQLVVTFTLNNAACNDSNVCTTDTCLVTGCQHANNSAPCNDGLFCNGTDTCGGGSCSVHSGNPCPGPDGDTNCAESCNETLDNCTANDPNGSPCRPTAGPCDVAETCSAGVCPPDGFATGGVCRAAAGACDNAETCNGSGPNCPPDAVKANTAVCRAAAGACDPAEFCDGSTKVCPADAKSTAVCRPAAGVCDTPESCNGTSNTCPANVFLPSSTACRVGTPGEVCDQTEFCTGTGPNCPADGVKPHSTLCRAGAGVCDLPEFCTGSSKFCPGDAKSTGGCRAAVDQCDKPEFCNGSSDDCPTDAFRPSTTVCRAASPGQVCDQNEFCPGNGPSCPPDAVKPNTVQCRAAAGVCDIAEFCDGSTKQCPADAKSTALCRSAAGVCDIAENCNGTSNACPPNAFEPSSTMCRAATDACDQTEFCTGSGANCPADGVKPNSALCRPAVDVCDAADFCNGSSKACPADAKSTAVCRPAADACDMAESCNGSSDVCPADVKKPDGTACPDGQFCNGAETCQSGICTAGADPCPFQICNEPTDSCTSCALTPVSGCRTAEKSLLLIKDKSNDAKDKLVWKFIKGQPTSFAELSDPQSTADYTLCLYAGSASALVGRLDVPASASLWSVLGNNKGYKYFDVSSGADGVQKVLLKASDENKTKALLKARGTDLPDGILGPMGLETPVTAQLVNHSSGVCWQGSYTTPKKNTDAQFKAKQ